MQHPNNIDFTSFEWSLNDSEMITLSKDGSILVWDLTTHTTLYSLPVLASPYISATYKKHAKEVIGSCGDGAIVIFSESAKSYQIFVQSLPLEKIIQSTHLIGYTPTGALNFIKLSIPTPKTPTVISCVLEKDLVYTQSITTMCMTTSGDILFTGTSDGCLQMLKLETQIPRRDDTDEILVNKKDIIDSNRIYKDAKLLYDNTRDESIGLLAIRDVLHESSYEGVVSALKLEIQTLVSQNETLRETNSDDSKAYTEHKLEVKNSSDLEIMVWLCF